MKRTICKQDKGQKLRDFGNLDVDESARIGVQIRHTQSRRNLRGCSSVWLECRPVTPEVAGSSPVTRAIGYRGWSRKFD